MLSDFLVLVVVLRLVNVLKLVIEVVVVVFMLELLEFEVLVVLE